MAGTFRDRDFLVTDSGVIFEVNDYLHSPEYVNAFPRYLPFDVIPIKMWDHTWSIGGREYSRFDTRVTTTADIQDTFRRFYSAYPCFSKATQREDSVLVPVNAIVEHVTPHGSLLRLRSLENLDELQAAAVQFADFCIALGIPQECLGVSYSLMFDAHTIGFSDIDFVLYGGQNYRIVIDCLRSPRCHPSIRFPTVTDWEQRYRAYAVQDMSLDPLVYARHKVRKHEESFFDDHKLSLIAVRSGEAATRMQPVRRVGPLQITGQVVDASEGIFRPSIYKIQLDCTDDIISSPGGMITLVNYRREYIAQVQTGERIEAFGLASEVHGGSLLLELGSVELRGRDFLIAEELR